MLFKKFHIPWIKSGKKTETRRFKKPRVIIGHIYKPKTHFLRKERLGYIKILKVWEEKLGNISPGGVRREGYRTRKDYFNAFAEAYHADNRANRKLLRSIEDAVEVAVMRVSWNF